MDFIPKQTSIEERAAVVEARDEPGADWEGDLSLRIPAVNQADAQRTPIGENFISQYINPIQPPDGNHILLLN